MRTTRRGSSPAKREEQEGLADEALDPVLPGRSAFAESPRRRSTPRFLISASLPTSVLSLSTGV